MASELVPIYVTISGSFKRSKPQIDRDRDVFEARGITVLSPARGGLFLPTRWTNWGKNSYPLGPEKDMDEMDAKGLHHQAIKVSDYLYVENQKLNDERFGYLGSSTWWEIVTAVTHKVPIFAREPFDPAHDDYEPKWLDFIEHVNVMPPEAAADLMNRVGKDRTPGLYVPQHIVHKMHGCTDHMRPYEIAIYEGIPLAQAKQIVAAGG